MVIFQNNRSTNFHWSQQVIYHLLLWLHPKILGIGWRPSSLPSIPNSWWPCSIMIFHGLNILELVGFFFESSLRLKHSMEKKDIHYQYVVLVRIWVACSLCKLAHGAKYLQCSEQFAINKSIVHLVLQEFMFFMNILFQN